MPADTPAPGFHRQFAAEAKSWPFQEARALLKRLEREESDAPVLFETGYGPSGLPHIGTFGEVARTSMVRRAFMELSDRPTKLICFSDDMDGLRKVPENVPRQEMLSEHLQKPLSAVPDPFGEHESFAAHNNARLRGFLDQFGFDYEFRSATEQYRSGVFDAMLRRMLERYDDVMDIILPTLGEERRATYAPFLPISPSTGRVLYVPMLERDARRGEVVFEDENGERVTTSVDGGAVKLQWKADWAGRWYALGVDYEMSGEDLTESVRLSSRIVKALGGRPPAGLSYQLFLDENGEKISKSKGNGLTIEEWLRYASPESLALFMYQAPKKAKKLYFDIIPKTVDEYWSHLANYREAEAAKRLDNPAWHVHSAAPPEAETPVSFALLLNLVSAANASDKETLWGFISRYAPEASPDTHPALDALAGYAIAYYEDFVRPTKRYRQPTAMERAALEDLAARLSSEAAASMDAEALQTEVFSAGKTQDFENLRDWFKAIYEVVLGQTQGPRFGSFAAIYGPSETSQLIEDALGREPENGA
ncbi:MAG: lysine--tRNA ligase [Pseudomonadota bacterium]